MESVEILHLWILKPALMLLDGLHWEEETLYLLSSEDLPPESFLPSHIKASTFFHTSPGTIVKIREQLSIVHMGVFVKENVELSNISENTSPLRNNANKQGRCPDSAEGGLSGQSMEIYPWSRCLYYWAAGSDVAMLPGEFDLQWDAPVSMETLVTETMAWNEESALLNPVGTWTEVIINSPPQTCPEHGNCWGFDTLGDVSRVESVWAVHPVLNPPGVQLLFWPGQF